MSVASFAVAALTMPQVAQAQETQTNGVQTIAGAFPGFVDGNNLISQLASPYGVAHDGTNSLYIADRGNNALRVLRVQTEELETLIGRPPQANPLNGPVDVALDRQNNIFVANYNSGKIVRYNLNSRQIETYPATFNRPVAIDFDENAQLVIAEEGGVLRTLNGIELLRHQPGGQAFRGLASVGGNLFAVTDSGLNVVWLLGGNRPLVIAGAVNQPGYINGELGINRINAPHHIAVTPAGGLVFADRSNHRIAHIDQTYKVSTLFGLPQSEWVTLPGTFPGWADGPVDWAESREPIGVDVTQSGVLYDSEVFYHIVRKATGLLATNTTSTNLPLSAVLTPSSGYYPAGTTVIVSPADNSPFGPGVQIFYTLNGTDPSQFDTQAAISNGEGVIVINQAVDLANLKVRVFNNGVPGPVVSGQAGSAEPVNLILTPNSGFYAEGVEVQVSNATGGNLGPQVKLFYTLNGSDPTTNSTPAAVINGLGRIVINKPIDLANLRVRAFNNGTPGEIARGEIVSLSAPAISPSSGYFLTNVTVTITNRNDDSGMFPQGTRLFYTINGADPDINSPEVPMVDGRGVLELAGPIDLADLRVVAVFGDITSDVGAGSNIIVPTPFIAPDSGYYPMGVRVYIGSTNEFPAGTQIFYTTDGQIPTTNSLAVSYEGTQPYINWRESRLDLRSLKVRAFTGRSSSPATSGRPVDFGNPAVRGEVGIPEGLDGTNYIASIGSTYILPVIANLRDAQVMRSLQFVVEVEPLEGSRPLERSDVTYQVMSTNDFVQVTAASTTPPDSSISTLRNGINRLSISYFGTNSGFNVNGFGTVAMLRIQFRPGTANGETASHGDQYRIRIDPLTLSGTADGEQQSIALVKLPDRVITLSTNRSEIAYLLGDSSPGYWYNAGDFGNNRLDNADVNNVIFAALGFRAPYFNSDAFWAMNVSRDGIFGDTINFTDAETVLRRSLGFDLTAATRARDAAGNLVDVFVPSNFNPPLPPPMRQNSIEEPAWHRDAMIYAGNVGVPAPGSAVRVPIYLKPDAGCSVFGFQFVAEVWSATDAPNVSGARFIPSQALPLPSLYGSTVPGLGSLPNAIYARWNNLEPGVQSTVLLGHLEFIAPAELEAGHAYSVLIHHADGAALNETTGALIPYAFETARGSASLALPPPPVSRISDDWKVAFFGDLDAPEGAADVDFDDDGFSNLHEYLAGTDPTAEDWHIQSDSSGAVTFRWVGEAGKRYTVEKTTDFSQWQPVTQPVAGQDALLHYNEITPPGRAGFYRLRIEQ